MLRYVANSINLRKKICLILCKLVIIMLLSAEILVKMRSCTRGSNDEKPYRKIHRLFE